MEPPAPGGVGRRWRGGSLHIARVASFLVRAAFNGLPLSRAVVAEPAPPVRPLSGGWFGLGAGAANTASLASGMMGLRLHPAPGPVYPYLDALVGVGWVRDGLPSRQNAAPGGHEVRDDANVALSFGLGVKLLLVAGGSLFADAHYDFYFVEDAPSPIVPVKLGYALR